MSSKLNEKYDLFLLDTSQKKRLYSNPDVPGAYCLLYTTMHLIRLSHLMYKRKARIIHIQSTSGIGFLRDSLFILIGKLCGGKIICHFHGALHRESPILKYGVFRRYFQFVMNYVDTVVLLSERFVSALDEIVPRTPKTVVPNFVSQFDTVQKGSEPQASVLFVGRLSEKKGVYDLLKAATLLRDKRNICFKLAGLAESQADGDRIVSELDKCDMQDTVSLVGYVQGQDKATLFADSSIFVLPSYTEIFPVAILEAMAAGMPVIATPVGAIPDIIEDGVNGFIVPKGDYRLLAERILYLIRDPEKRAEMSRNNVEAAKYRYGIERNVERIDRIYEGLLRGTVR